MRNALGELSQPVKLLVALGGFTVLGFIAAWWVTGFDMAYFIGSIPFLIMLVPLILLVVQMERPHKAVKPHKKLQRVLAPLAEACLFASLVVSQISMHPEYSRIEAVQQNIGIGLILAGAFFSLMVMNFQQSAYGLPGFRLDPAKMDERQIQVRRRVFEKAYDRLLLATILMLWLADLSTSFMQTRVVWVGLILAIAMPSLVAARQKDS